MFKEIKTMKVKNMSIFRRVEQKKKGRERQRETLHADACRKARGGRGGGVNKSVEKLQRRKDLKKKNRLRKEKIVERNGTQKLVVI